MTAGSLGWLTRAGVRYGLTPDAPRSGAACILASAARGCEGAAALAYRAADGRELAVCAPCVREVRPTAATARANRRAGGSRR